MKNSGKLIFSLSICACIALSAMADERTDLGEVVVTDTALEAQIKSITSEKLENLQASDIKDILKSMPSVIVDGNARYSQKVYIRGLEDKSSNITIDGARISGQLFHHTGDQTVDAEMLKIGSIELGPNSALSGSGVINGAFIYETKDPSDYLKEGETFGGKISAGYQSAFGRKSLDVAVFSKVNEKIEFVGIGNLSEDTKIEIPDSEDIKTKQSKLKSGLLKVIIKPTDANTFKLSYNKYQDGGDRQYAGEKAGSDDIDKLVDPFNEISRDTYTINYNYSPGNELINIDAKAYISSQTLFVEGGEDRRYWTYSKADSTIKGNDPDVTFENKTSGLDLRNTSLVDSHKITYGISYETEEQKSEADGLGTYTGGPNTGNTYDLSVEGGKTETSSLYLEDEAQINRLLLTIGARYDVHELGGVYSGKNSQLSPKLKAEFQASDELKLRAAYGKIFKGPSLGETAMLVYGVSSNSKDTKAQTGNNYELGFDYDLANSLNADSAVFGFTAYTYNVDNYMHPTKNLKLTNQSDIKVWGVESVIRYEKNSLALSASHTYTDGEVKEVDTGDTYDYRAAKIHTFKTEVDYKIAKKLFFNYSAEFVATNHIKSEYYSYFTDSEKRPGYAVHNISSTYTPSSMKNTKILFGIDNVFDKKYQKHTSFGAYYGTSDAGSYEAGRNYKIKLSYKF